MKKALKMAIILGFGILAIAAIACSSNDASTGSGTEAKAVDTVRESVKDIVMKSFMTNRSISELSITQDGNDMSLVMVVDCSTSLESAKIMGDRFVRLLKQFSTDLDPSTAEIGTGDYNYVVGVSCENGNSIAMGSKTSDSAQIAW